MRSFSNQIQGPLTLKRGPKCSARRHATIRLNFAGSKLIIIKLPVPHRLSSFWDPFFTAAQVRTQEFER